MQCTGVNNIFYKKLFQLISIISFSESIYPTIQIKTYHFVQISCPSQCTVAKGCGIRMNADLIFISYNVWSGIQNSTPVIVLKYIKVLRMALLQSLFKNVNLQIYCCLDFVSNVQQTIYLKRFWDNVNEAEQHRIKLCALR